MAAVDAAEFPIGMVAVALAAGRVSTVAGAVAAAHGDTAAVAAVVVAAAAAAAHADTGTVDEIGSTAED